MAVRVIDPGPDPSVVKKAVCSNCGARLEYVPNDVKDKVVGDYGGGSDVYHWIDCPQCSKAVYL
jgi:uncharacterized protein with PIN domain